MNLLEFRASDFLLSPPLTESQTSSPDVAAALAGPEDTSGLRKEAERVGSRLGKARHRAKSLADHRALVAEVRSEESSRSASPSSPIFERAVCCGDLHPQPGGESPALQEPTDALPWVEDSCRDVCECASPAAIAAVAHPQHELHAAIDKAQLQACEGREPEQAHGRHAEQSTPCTLLDLASRPIESEQQTGSAGKALQPQQLTHPHAPALTGRLETAATPATSGSYNSAQQGSTLDSALRNGPLPAGLPDSRANQQVELLRAKLAAECEARQALEIQLTNQQHQAATAYHSLEESYQAKLKDLQQQLQQAAARSGVGRSLQERIQSGATQVILTGEDLEALRTEMQDHEMLLQAYQAENELAVERMKAMQSQHIQDMSAAAEKRQQLERELSLLSASASDRGEHPQHQRPPATPQAGVGVNAARLHEVLSLQSQLEAIQEAAFLTEQELRAKVGLAEAQRQEAQDKLKQMEAHNAQAHAQVVQQVQALRLEHARQVADMECKLAWYAENYELLQGNEDLLRQQARTIVQLEQQLLLSPQRLSNSHEAVGRLAELEEENVRLKARLAHSVASSSDREASLVEVLQQKLQQLQGAMAQREADYEKKQRALRQECEKMRLENTKRASVSKAATARLKETEQQIEEVRSSYRKKVQALELRLKAAEAKAANLDHCQGAGRPFPKPAKPASQNAATPAPSAPHADTGSKSELRIRKLESELARKEAELASLQKRVTAADELVNQAAAREQDMGVTLRSLQQSVAEVGTANQALRSQLGELQDMRTQLAANKSGEAQVRDLQHKLGAAEATLAALKQAHADALAVHQAELQSAREQHGTQLTQAQQLGEQLASVAWQTKLSAAERAVDELQHRVRGLECSLSDARAGITWTPKAMEFSALEKKIGELEQQQTQREMYWRSLVDETTSKLSQQGKQMRQKFELALAAKDGQLTVFRRELDGILTAARMLHGPQQQSW